MSTSKSAKTKLQAKRKAPPTPDLPREKPSFDYARKEIAFEKNFPLAEMKKREECGWTMQYLEKNNYTALGRTFDAELYPRLVRLFYQNLTYDTLDDGTDYIEFTIDGFHKRITLWDMGEITNLPVEYSAERCPYLNQPLVFPEDQGIFDFLQKNFSQDGTKGKGESIIVSAIPEIVWPLDRIIRENVFPLGHRSERRSDVLYALYSAYKGHFYSMPYLFIQGITKMGCEIMARSPTGRTKALPYGFLITAILKYSEYPFDPREKQLDVDSELPLSAWISSYGRLALAKRKREEARKREETAAGTSASPPATPSPRPDTSTTPTVDERLARMESQQATLQNQQKTFLKRQKRQQTEHQRTDALIRALARHSLGDDYQRHIDAYELKVAQRGKATAVADDSEGSEYDAEEDSETESD